MQIKLPLMALVAASVLMSATPSGAQDQGRLTTAPVQLEDVTVTGRPLAPQSLTDWDMAYLQGVYGAQQTATNRRSGRAEVRESIKRAHRQITAEGVAEDGI